MHKYNFHTLRLATILGLFIISNLAFADEKKAPTTCKSIRIGILAQINRKFSPAAFRFGQEIVGGVHAGMEYVSQKQKAFCFESEILDIGNTLANIPAIIKQANAKGIKYFIGLGLSDQVRVAIPSLIETKSILISPTASDDDLANPSNHAILMYPRNSLIADQLARAVLAKNIKKIGVIHAYNYKVGNDILATFRRIFVAGGGRIEADIEIRSGSIDFTSIEKGLSNLNYTHIFLPLLETDATRIISFLNTKKAFATKNKRIYRHKRMG